MLVDFDVAKGLGFWGYITVLLGIVVSASLGPPAILSTPILNLAGYTLLILSFYFLSKYYGRGSISRSSLISLVLGFTGLMTIFLLVIAGALGSRGEPGGVWFARLTLTLILGLVVVLIPSGVFWYRALSELHEASSEPMVERAAFAYGLSVITASLALITMPIAIIALPPAFIPSISMVLNWIFLAQGSRNLGETED